MKSIKTYILAGVILSLSACSLDEEVLDEADSKSIIENAGPDNIIAPAYAHLRSIVSTSPSPWILNEQTSDEMMVPTRGSNWDDGGIWRMLHQHQWDASNGFIAEAWSNIESGVAKCNTGLFLLNEYEQTAEVQTLVAELRFLRTFYRFWLLDHFRQIPLRDELDQDFDSPPAVLKGETAFEWLIDELNEIIPQMRSVSDEPGFGRASREAAQSLLAKIYLNGEVYTGTPYWQECLEVCDALISLGVFELSQDYFAAFQIGNNVNNPEAIFVARQSKGINGFSRIFIGPPATLHYGQTFGMTAFVFNGLCTIGSFLEKWDEDNNLSNGISSSDIRFQDNRTVPSLGTNIGVLYGPQFNPDGSPILVDDQQLSYTLNPQLFDSDSAGARILKYEPDPSSVNDNPFLLGTNDYLIIRYADVVLMRIESLFRLGDVGTALSELNELRQLRNVPIKTSLVAEDILDERAFELYWEGWRRQDLVRFGKFGDAWSNKELSADFKKVFPIPQDALSVNPNLKQNTGY